MNHAPHILTLEDQPAEAERIARVLHSGNPGLKLHFVESRELFERALDAHRPDAILSDHGVPNLDGLGALAIARHKRPDVPFILVTGSAKDPLTLAALERGADGFVSKDNYAHWVPKLKRSLKQGELVARQTQMEQALREWGDKNQRARAELEELVARRTRELQVATKELEAFSYSISHDLRAPLRHINVFLALLEQSLKPNLTEETRQRFQVVASAAEHLGDLLDDLLNLSRVGRQELRKIGVSLGSLVEEAKNRLCHEMAGRDIEWVIGPLPMVQADPIALRQVLVNLLSNALKYSSMRRCARIEIDCLETPSEVVCRIRDNGVGFDMQNSFRLFGVFQRLHSEKEFEGTGIGLAIVRRVIHRHGGRVWAEGAVDHGASFYFSLPKEPGQDKGA